MLRDIRNQLKPIIALEPQTINSDTTTAGEIIDTKDIDGGLVFLLSCTHTSGTFTPLIHDGDESNLSDAAVVADTYLIGDTKTAQEAGAALTADQLTSSIGVVNNMKRYVRISIVSTGTADAIVSVEAAGKSEQAPITN